MRRLFLILLLLLSPLAGGAADTVRYVSDELVIVMRDSPGGTGAVVGSLNSGARLELLETDINGYGKVRLGDGRSGWVQVRYLTTVPPARQRAESAEKQLAQAEAELKTLREEHGKLLKDFTRISAGQPPPPPEAVTRELEQLRARVQELQQRNEALEAQAGQAREKQRTLLIGGGLVALGFVLAWVLRWLWPKRRWGEL